MRALPVLLLVLVLAGASSAPAAAQHPNDAALAHERLIEVHEALIWVGVLNAEAGQVNQSEYQEAITTWRARQGSPTTGPLTEAERVALVDAAGKERLNAVFTLVDDQETGVRVRLPLALVPLERRRALRYGSEWSSPDRSIVISTYRLKQGTHSIGSWQRYWLERLAPRVGYQQLLNDSLVLEGEYDHRPRKDEPVPLGLRQFHLRAHAYRGDIIGVHIDYDPARAAQMERIVNAIASRFQRDNGWREAFLRKCSGAAAAAASNGVMVVYATNRTPLARERLSGKRLALGELYQAKQDGRLHLGCVEVSVPADDAEKARFNVGSATFDAARDFYAERHERLIESDDGEPGQLISLVDDRGGGAKRALVFIHGYNVSFAHAAARVAQLAKDTGYQGNVFLFSWPSLGAWRAYGADLDQAEQSEPYLESFLRMILNNRNVERLDVVAHSMGSQPTLRVLRLYSRLFEARGGEGRRRRGWGQLGQVIFAAPDVGRELFREQVRAILPVAEQITLYGSPSDCAMQGSRWARYGVRRAGDTAEGALVVDGVDTIEAPGSFASNIMESLKTMTWDRVSALLGVYCNHSYFAERPGVLTDIRRLLGGGSHRDLRPERRAPGVLVPADTRDGRRYWKLVAG